MEGDVADDHLFSQFEELVGYGVVVAVVFEVLHQDLLVVGLTRRHYYGVLEDVLSGGWST